MRYSIESLVNACVNIQKRKVRKAHGLVKSTAKIKGNSTQTFLLNVSWVIHHLIYGVWEELKHLYSLLHIVVSIIYTDIICLRQLTASAGE